MKGFREFILRGNVVDLAVAVVVGAAFGAVVVAFVKDLITPLIAAIGGQPDFSRLTFTIHKSQFFYGDFINTVIAFIIIAAVIYFLVVLPLNKLLERVTPQPKEPRPTRECPQCLSTIPRDAARCAFCTTQLSPA